MDNHAAIAMPVTGKGKGKALEADASDASRPCEACGTKAAADVQLLTCSRCKSVLYCSTQCQRARWKAHKPACKQIVAQREADTTTTTTTAATTIAISASTPAVVVVATDAAGHAAEQSVPQVPVPQVPVPAVVDLMQTLPVHVFALRPVLTGYTKEVLCLVNVWDYDELGYTFQPMLEGCTDDEKLKLQKSVRVALKRAFRRGRERTHADGTSSFTGEEMSNVVADAGCAYLSGVKGVRKLARADILAMSTQTKYAYSLTKDRLPPALALLAPLKASVGPASI